MRREHTIGEDEDIVLPDGYIRLQYIECTGENYIDTGISPQPDLKWYIELQWLDFNTNNMFGAEDWNGRHVIIRINQISNATGISTVYGNTNGYKTYAGNDYPNTNRMTFYFENEHQYLDGQQIMDGVMTNIGNKSIYYFAAQANTATMYFCKKARHYYSWMKNGDTLIREFIPALRVSDSKPGLYDTVNDVFYTNAGTGEFLYN